MYLLAPSNLESVAIFYFAATANGVIGAAYARNKISGKWLFRFKAQGPTVRVPSQVITISRRSGCGSNFRFFVSAAALGTGSAQTLPRT
jgi:hypothetical protein